MMSVKLSIIPVVIHLLPQENGVTLLESQVPEANNKTCQVR